MKKLTTEKFIERTNLVHGNKYDYSLVNYVNAKTKIKIICSIHGEFLQTPDGHLSGNGCPKCKLILLNNKFKDSSKEFIEKAKLVHGDKYDYSLANYINAKTKVDIICSEHGKFEQIPDNHLRKKYGCPFCNESKGEKEIARILTEMKIEFQREFSFNNCRNILPLPFDFYIKKTNTVIEYQGRQHYEVDGFMNKTIEDLLFRKKLDKIKINYCFESNINLITINYNDNIANAINNKIQHPKLKQLSQ